MPMALKFCQEPVENMASANKCQSKPNHNFTILSGGIKFAVVIAVFPCLLYIIVIYCHIQYVYGFIASFAFAVI